MKKLFALLFTLSPLLSTTAHAVIADPLCAGLPISSWPQNAQGFTILPSLTQTGRRVIYVSAKNTVHNDGVHYYVQTPDQGVALLRVGLPDSLLFNRGETFHLASSIVSYGLDAGSLVANAKVVGAYGTGARPILMWNQAHSLIAIEHYPVSNLIITQLDLEPDPSLAQQGTGITISNACTNCLIEDVKVNGFQKGMDLEQNTNLNVRRNEIINSCGGYRSQGIYAATNKGIKLEQNYMDRNGLQICGNISSGSPEGQGVYVQSDNACFRAFGNVVSRSLGNTLEARVGGIIEGNVFIGSSTALNYGLALGGSVEGKTSPRGVYGDISGNVFMDNTIDVQFGNVANATLQNNIFAHAATTPAAEGSIILDSQNGIGINGLTVSGNTVSNAKYFLSFQYGVPPGPVKMYNDGSKTQWQDCDGAFGAANGTAGHAQIIWQYVSTPKTPAGCFNGLSVNGADIYTQAGAKVIDSVSTGIYMLVGEAPVLFSLPNLITGNLIKVSYHEFELSQTPLDTNPAAKFMPETNDNLAPVYVNSVFDYPDTIFAAMAAQSGEAWNASIEATTLIAQAQAAYKAK